MREAVTVWAVVILGLAVLEGIGLAVPFVHSLTGAIAVAAFLYVPVRMLEKRGQDAEDAGWRFDRLRADLAWGLGASAVVLPLFALAFWAFPRWLSLLPRALHALLAPYAGHGVDFQFPLTLDFFGQVAGNAAVAFSEEFFYRGYMTLRFEEARWRAIPTALAVAGFFAVGHLLTPAPWRLAVFFPALLFAFLRNRTRTIVGAAICHFLCNVWLLVLRS